MGTILAYPLFLEIIQIIKFAKLTHLRELGHLSHMNETTYAIRTPDTPLDNLPQIQYPLKNSNLIIP